MLFSKFNNLISRYCKKIKRIKTVMLYKPLIKKIGKGSIINKQYKLTGLKYIELGDNVELYAGSRIEVIDKFLDVNYVPLFSVGNNTEIHQNCHITCAGEIRIGNNVRIVSNVTITDIVHPHYDVNKPTYLQSLKVSKVSIGDETYIYNNAVILPNVAIGRHCIIGANSVVNTDVPDYSVVAGNPAKIISQYNAETKQWMRVK